MGQPIAAAKRRGRPPGSGNKRAKDLQGFIAAKYGASAAQQSAALCMITPGELKAAGGSMAKAQVAKALDLVGYVRRAQDGLDEQLRELVRLAVRDLADELANGGEVRDLVKGFLARVKEGTAGFGLVQAMKMIADERAALLPYTDQKQPLAVDLSGKMQVGPAVVFQLGAGAAQAMPVDAEFTEVFEVAEGQVSQSMSHDESQAPELPGLLPAPPTD